VFDEIEAESGRENMAVGQGVVEVLEGRDVVEIVHPHLLAAIVPGYPGIPLIEEKREILNGILHDGASVPKNISGVKKASIPCPIWYVFFVLKLSPSIGHGFKHSRHCTKEARKKDATRCKTCVSCASCKGLGVVSGGLVECTGCVMRGFTHPDGHEHDAPEDLRCFFCVRCVACKGTLLVKGDK
jgi:hypothetical protein